jgi:hypothetical protein
MLSIGKTGNAISGCTELEIDSDISGVSKVSSISNVSCDTHYCSLSEVRSKSSTCRLVK